MSVQEDHKEGRMREARGNLWREAGLDAGGAGRSVLDEMLLVFARQLLERLALRLGCSPDRHDQAEQHEKGKDLDDVCGSAARSVPILAKQRDGE